MALHVLHAVALAGLVFPWISAKSRLHLEQRWSAGLMRILNIHVRVQGTPPDFSAHNSMLIANHVSWLDIYLLNSVRPARFVSKSEVRSWPVIGWLAHKVGTFFIDRGRRHDTARVNHEMSAALGNGGCVAVFPEGTTSQGDTLLPFHPSLLQPAVHSASKIWPTAIRYSHADGSLNIAASYAGDMSFGTSLANILSQSKIYADMVFIKPIAAHGNTRRELAQQTQQAIAEALSLNPHARESSVVPAEQMPELTLPALAAA